MCGPGARHGIRDGWLGTSAVRAAWLRVKDVARYTPVGRSCGVSDESVTGRFAAVAQRHETAATQGLRLFTHISDRPGEFAALLGARGRDGRDLVTVDNMREAVPLHVRRTGVEVLGKTRGWR